MYFHSFLVRSRGTKIEPENDQTVLVNGSNTFRFRCSGKGLYINWLVNGMSTNSDIIKQRGIEVHNDKQYDDVASANLTVPTIVENNNTIVNCVVINLESPLSLSKHVKLILIGKKYIFECSSISLLNRANGNRNWTDLQPIHNHIIYHFTWYVVSVWFERLIF